MTHLSIGNGAMTIPTEKILEAADRAGFDSELKVAATLAKSGWQVNQNVHFIDKDENKGRELDIEAYRFFNQISDKPESTCLIELLVEVKKTRDPFLFFSSPPRTFEHGKGYGIFHWKNKVDHKILPYEEIERHRPLKKLKRIARSYSGFKDGKTSQIAAGIFSSFKAAIHYEEACNEIYSDVSSDIAFFFPLVVVDGEIYDCHLNDETHELIAEKVESVTYMQNYHTEGYGRVSNRVAVLTISALQSYIDDIEKMGTHIVKTMRENRNASDE